MNAKMPTYVLVSADENALISSIAKNWTGALPSTILYNVNGEMTYLKQGKISPEMLTAKIEEILQEAD
jgi:hypothetical protein